MVGEQLTLDFFSVPSRQRSFLTNRENAKINQDAERREQERKRKREKRALNPEFYREMHRNWIRRNPDRYKELRARGAAKRKERGRDKELVKNKEFWAANRERLCAAKREYYQVNKERVLASAQASKARRRNAVPTWANLAAIARIYEECVRINVQSGVEHEVDHIVPISGKNVCGLHVEWNLRIVTRAENRAKHNKMPAPSDWRAVDREFFI